jgi:hypothetical protein
MRAAHVVASLLAVVLLLGATPVSAWDPPPPPAPPLERLFAPLKEQMKPLPPFFRDADVITHFRLYYFNRVNPDDTENEALAFGGWLTVRSGWLLDTLAIGATLYGSAPLHAPDDKDGTLLLKAGQEGYYVPGEAWLSLRYKDYAIFTGYRQLIDLGYVNPQDNRMTPNTFEAVTLGGKVGWLQYLAGYIWNIKPRNADEFISMSAQAGVKGEGDGAAIGGVRLTPIPGLRIDLNDAWGIDTFNTLFLDGDYLYALNSDWKLRFGAQFTDQRAVNQANLQNASERYWSVQSGGTRLQVIFRELTLTGAFTITGSGNDIQRPWGSYPGYMSMIDQDFVRANEHAVLLGIAYDFSKLARGVSAYTNIAWGWDAINPRTRARVGDRAEYDVTVDYRPPFQWPAFLQGLWFRARAAVLDQDSSSTTGYQFRLILNWERNLL